MKKSLSLLVVLFGFGGQAGPVEATADDPAAKAAASRQEKYQTLSVEFRQTDVLAPGGASEESLPPFKPKEPVPDKETKIESTNRLVFDGSKVRFENNHPSWLMPQGKLLHRSGISLTNGSLAVMFYPNGQTGDSSPEGFVGRTARAEEISLVYLVPLTMTFRGQDPAISPYLIGDLKATGTSLRISGALCQEYLHEPSPNASMSIWMEVARDYVIRRISNRRAGKVVRQCDIDYRDEGSYGPVPSSWRLSNYSPSGALFKTISVEVREYRINERQPPELFELEFPAGTTVYDNKKRKQFRVQSDGSMRELSPTGEELPGSVPQPGFSWFRRNRWLLAALGAVAIGVPLILFVRKKRQNTP